MAGKGSGRRPENASNYNDNYDRIFMKHQDTIYYIETPREIWWSKRKMDVTFKHVEMLYKDKARSKQAEEDKFKRYIKKVDKKIYELKGDD